MLASASENFQFLTKIHIIFLKISTILEGPANFLVSVGVWGGLDKSLPSLEKYALNSRYQYQDLVIYLTLFLNGKA